MPRWGKRLALGLLFTFLAVNFSCAAFLIWLSSSVPRIEGNAALDGLTAPVTVARDSVGIPTISAESDGDAYFALGFVHAQDRLWQMEYMRRIGAGRMAEIVGNLSTSFGNNALTFDRMSRSLGFYRRAKEIYREASPEVRFVLERYADGVNAYLTSRDGALPPEFIVLFHEPEPWEPADSLVWQQLMGFQLGTNWFSELARLRMMEAGLSREQIAFLYQQPNGQKPDIAPLQQGRLSPQELKAAAQFAAALPAPLTPDGASNAWALSGSRTESGKPLLANDPHLRLTNPNLWYLTRIKTPESALSGLTVPGVPFLILGHNDSIAWGFTTPQADTQDIFIEQVDPNNPAHYLTPDGSQPFETSEERFLNGDREIIETFRSTRHGPVLSDIWSNAKRSDGDTVLTLSAASFSAGDNTAESFLRLNRAGSVDEALLALKIFPAHRKMSLWRTGTAISLYCSPGEFQSAVRAMVSCPPMAQPELKTGSDGSTGTDCPSSTTRKAEWSFKPTTACRHGIQHYPSVKSSRCRSGPSVFAIRFKRHAPMRVRKRK